MGGLGGGPPGNRSAGTPDLRPARERGARMRPDVASPAPEPCGCGRRARRRT
jgi:hypothetical protein